MIIYEYTICLTPKSPEGDFSLIVTEYLRGYYIE